MKRVLLCCLVLGGILFASCTHRKIFDAGDSISGEELNELQAKLRQELAEENCKQEETEPTEGVCYFTENGSVYHFDPGCSYLSSAKQVRSGSKEEAMAAGIIRGCSRCAAEP